MAHALRQRFAPFLNSQRAAFRPGFPAASARSFSASSARHENIEEALKWRKITTVAYVACTALGVYTFVGGDHHEQHGRPEYSYLHIRNKEFPWGPDGLFERPKHNH